MENLDRVNLNGRHSHQWTINKEVPYKKKKRLHSKYCLTIYLILIPIWMFIITLMMYFNSNNIYKLTQEPPPAWIQLNSGQTIVATANEPWYRSESVITSLAKQWAIASLSWSGKLENGTKDNGALVGKKKITLTTWEASALLTPKLQPIWRKEIADMTPSGVFEGTTAKDKTFQAKTETVLYIENKDKLEAVMVQPGYWQVDLVGHISLIHLSNFTGKNIPFNKRIIFKAIPYLSISPNQKLSPTQLAAYKWRTQGLEIVKIEEYNGSNKAK